MRTTQGCINCGDQREIVAHGLCSMCYMRRRRENEREIVLPDRSQRTYLVERNKEHSRLIGVVKLVDELVCLSDEERQTVKSIIQGHLLRHVLALAPPEDNPPTTSMPEPAGPTVPLREPGDEDDAQLTVNEVDEINVDSASNYEWPHNDSESTVNEEDGVNVSSIPSEPISPQEEG